LGAHTSIGAFLTLAFFLLFVSTQESLSAKPRKVLVGLFPAAPLVYEANRKPTGLFIDLIDYYARANDWQVEYLPGTWSELLVKLKEGKIDLLPAVGYTAERAQVYDFSRNPIYVDSGVIFTKPNRIPRTIYDLDGKRIAAVRGSVFTEGFKAYISSFGVQCEILYTSDNPEVMERISDGSADAGVCIYSLGSYLAKSYKVSVTPISFSPVALLFAAPRGRNGDLIRIIDAGMVAMLDNPSSAYNKINNKWTHYMQPSRVPESVIVLLLGVLALGAFLGAWALILKKQVQRKTSKLNEEIGKKTAAEQELKHSLDEKNVLIRELYHRTKNNMQIISSMISLKASYFPHNEELRQVAKGTTERINAISLVQQMLYQAQDLSEISIKAYLEELASSLIANYSTGECAISLSTDLADMHILIDSAIPLGLILNELLTNSLKYAFAGRERGAVSVSFKPSGPESYLFDYSDDGLGLSEGFDFRTQGSLGLTLVQEIGEKQLGGRVSFVRKAGLQCLIEIPKLIASH